MNVKDVDINGYLEAMMRQKSAQNVRVLIGIGLKKKIIGN